MSCVQHIWPLGVYILQQLAHHLGPILRHADLVLFIAKSILQSSFQHILTIRNNNNFNAIPAFTFQALQNLESG